MRNSIPYGRQDIRRADIDAVLEVLSSDFLTQGPVVPLFEDMIADTTEVNYFIDICRNRYFDFFLHLSFRMSFYLSLFFPNVPI